MLKDCLTNFRVLLLRELFTQILAHEVYVAVHRLNPGLTAPLIIYPARVGAVVNKLAERIFEVLSAFFYKGAHFLGHLATFTAHFSPPFAIEDVGLSGSHVVMEHQLLLYVVLRLLNAGNIVLLGLVEREELCYHRSRDTLGSTLNKLPCHAHCLAYGGNNALSVKINNRAIALANLCKFQFYGLCGTFFADFYHKKLKMSTIVYLLYMIHPFYQTSPSCV